MVLGIATLAAMVLVPYLYWRGTWFGRPLSIQQIEQYLNDEKNPRHIQHALVQISQKLDRGDRSAEKWYPRIAVLAGHPVAELRVTAAWVMGRDSHSELFHQALGVLLRDPEPIVRRNAALALANFHDAAARPELRAMLEPYTLRAPREGVLTYRLKVGEMVNRGTLVARLETGEKEPTEVRAPLPGKLEFKMVSDGARMKQNEEIVVLAPSPDHVWEALRALYLVGTPEDLAAVEKFTLPASEWPERIAQQAALTSQQIRARAHGP
ncbi:MAG: HEAT repeat domain-containing protein [Acidobacteria bacterium]|nr:HEAT repeat domain-containing protein [Acidobacteriota bacterium]